LDSGVKSLDRNVALLDGGVTSLDCNIALLDSRIVLLHRDFTFPLGRLMFVAQLVALLSKLLKLCDDNGRLGVCIVESLVGVTEICRPGLTLIL
jgi:hypothetical protein